MGGVLWEELLGGGGVMGGALGGSSGGSVGGGGGVGILGPAESHPPCGPCRGMRRLAPGYPVPMGPERTHCEHAARCWAKGIPCTLQIVRGGVANIQRSRTKRWFGGGLADHPYTSATPVRREHDLSGGRRHEGWSSRNAPPPPFQSRGPAPPPPSFPSNVSG